RRAASRLGGRAGGTPDRYRHRAGRPLRRRGRRVPHPAAQHRRVPAVRQLAGLLMPWLAAQLPPRFWRKVVAAVQGVVLTVAVSGLVDRPVGMIAVAVALLLLTESFGRDVVWLYRTGA